MWQIFLKAENFSDVPLIRLHPDKLHGGCRILWLEYQAQRVVIPVTPYTVSLFPISLVLGSFT